MKLKQHMSVLAALGLGLFVLIPAGACGDAKTDAGAVKPDAGVAKPATPPEVKVHVDTSGLTPAADFELPDLSGKMVSLASLRGQVVILNFWATWCGPCKYEIPHFIKLYNAYKDKGVTILGVSIGESKGQVEPFARTKGMTYPVLLDQKSLVPRNYGGVRGIPTTFVITQDGKIYRKHVGVPPSMTIFEEEVKALLGDTTTPQ